MHRFLLRCRHSIVLDCGQLWLQIQNGASYAGCLPSLLGGFAMCTCAFAVDLNKSL